MEDNIFKIKLINRDNGNVEDYMYIIAKQYLEVTCALFRAVKQGKHRHNYTFTVTKCSNLKKPILTENFN
ncbi:MAG: hypothetical protein IJ748_02140 [Bacteroidales bacterium]|nr:hypothetical protein [Bacteroidales bacterium]